MKKKGKHLIINFYGCETKLTMQDIYDLFNKLSGLVKMKQLICPYIVKGAPYNPGISGFVIIETSHISIHTFDNQDFIAFDLYSCKNFDEKIIIKTMKETLKPNKTDFEVFPR